MSNKRPEGRTTPMTCSACNGLLALLGALGKFAHFRCTCCGMDSHVEAATVELPENDE